MTRILKEPEVRKKEILTCAMKLFCQRGYDSVSIADIAKETKVVPGLCYRYFSSKKEIFDIAVKEYAIEECQEFIHVIQDDSKNFKERLELFGQIMLHKEEKSKYHSFFHAVGNETFHVQLSIEMFRYLAPYISVELSKFNDTGEIEVDDPVFMADFLLYGQASMWVAPHNGFSKKGLEERLKQVRSYIYSLLRVR